VIRQARYETMIGTGGIGSGVFFRLEGNATLGREESRAGCILDQRDYCKLHIVSHYVAALMGSTFSVIPVGRVGLDDAGERLLTEMGEVGLDLRYVRRTPERPTTQAICLVYPDGSGCNLTTADSASSRVDAGLVGESAAEFARFEGHGVCAALPEVPLGARRALLRLGTRHGFLRVASFSSGELRELRRTGRLDQDREDKGWLELIDLLALNIDEAAALTGLEADQADSREIVDAMVSMLGERGQPVMATITAGARGSWAFDGAESRRLPAISAPMISTAGAGDAHLAGIIAGLAAGLTLFESHELARLVATMSITSPHTIHREINPVTLQTFARDLGIEPPPPVVVFLADRAGSGRFN